MDQLQPLPDDIQWVEAIGADGQKSTNITRYAYSASREAVIVEFVKNKKIWQYAGPTAISLFVALQAAPSQGSFFFKHIRNNEDLTVTELKGE